MLVMTVLGTGTYQETTYVWDDGERIRRYRSALFPVALDAWLAPERSLVLLTPDSAAHANWRQLQAQLGERAEPVLIPAGKSEAELWQIFDALVAAVPEQAELVLDVTHGFRSLPLFAAVAALVLRRLRGVTIQRILYGAFEARDRERDETPVFDLSPLVDLAEWASGIEALERSGDGRLLAARIQATHRDLYRRRSPELPRHLARVGKELDSLSQATWLARPLEALAAAHRLDQRLATAQEELARWTPPFAVLAERVRAEIGPLAHPEPEQLDEANLRAQLELIRYALGKGLVLQAVTLAREWLVSWYLWRTFPELRPSWLQRESRQRAENELNALQQQLRNGSPILDALPERRIAEVWDQVAQLRNDLAHCGMRPDPMTSKQTIDRAKRLVTGLAGLVDREDA